MVGKQPENKEPPSMLDEVLDRFSVRKVRPKVHDQEKFAFKTIGKEWTFAEGLRKLRNLVGIYQKDMAELMGVSLRTYQAYERGETPVPSNVIEALAKRNNLDVYFLFTGERSENVELTKEIIQEQILDAVEYLERNYPGLETNKRRKIVNAYLKGNNHAEHLNVAALEAITDLILD